MVFILHVFISYEPYCSIGESTVMDNLDLRCDPSRALIKITGKYG